MVVESKTSMGKRRKLHTFMPFLLLGLLCLTRFKLGLQSDFRDIILLLSSFSEKYGSSSALITDLAQYFCDTVIEGAGYIQASIAWFA